MFLGFKRTGKTLQETTNFPSYVPVGSKATVTKQPQDDNNTPELVVMSMDTTTSNDDARRPHQDVQTYHSPSCAADSSPQPRSSMTLSPSAASTAPKSTAALPAPHPDARTAIELLQAAVDLLKSHAEDAGSNIEQLRVLLLNREAQDYQSLQRTRFLEERRELDSHRALWSTTQKVSAILRDDEESFNAQRLSDRSLGLFNTSARTVANPPKQVKDVPSETPISDAFAQAKVCRGLVPLELASKADYVPIRRHVSFQEELYHDEYSQATIMPPPDDADTESSPPPPSTPPSSTTPALRPLNASISGKSRGTAAIYRHPSRDRETEVLLAQRIKDVQDHVTMPEYVGDLLSEFDAHVSEGPLLQPLSSDAPSSASDHSTKAKPILSAFKLTHKPSSLSVQLPASPAKMTRKASRNRFSEIFVSGSHSSSRKAQIALASAMTSPSLPPLSLDLEGSASDGRSAAAAALLTPGSSTLFSGKSSVFSQTSSFGGGSQYMQGISSALISPVSLTSSAGVGLGSPVSEREPRFSESSAFSLVSSSIHDEAQGHLEVNAKGLGKSEKGGIAKKLRKRISKLRG